jgi:rhodanese-related sulfurtransferase
MDQGLKEIRLDPSIILLDVRYPFEYLISHIPGALNVPVAELGKWANKKLDRHLKIYVYCEAGHRSAYAAVYLELLGFINVKNIGGLKEISIDSLYN